VDESVGVAAESTDRTSVRQLIPSALAVVGAWVPVMTGASQYLAFRTRDIVDATGWTATYSALSSAGWGVSIAALVVLGLLSDRSVRTRQGRSRLGALPLWVLLLAVAGMFIALADDLPALVVGWLLLQVPAAAVIVTASADSADRAGASGRWLVAGMLGSAPGAALLLGSAIVTVTGPTPRSSVLLPLALGVALTLPAHRRRWAAPVPHIVPVTPSSRSDPSPSEGKGPRPGRRLAIGMALPVLAAVALVDSGVGVALVYAVPLFERALTLPFAESARLASLALLLATVVSIPAGLLGGRLSRGRRGAIAAFSVTATLLAAALLLLIHVRTSTALISLFVAAGVTVGVSNGSTFGIQLLATPSATAHALRLGLVNAIQTVPYVLLPAIAPVLLRADPVGGLATLLRLAAVCCAAAASLMLLPALARRRGTPEGIFDGP